MWKLFVNGGLDLTKNARTMLLMMASLALTVAFFVLLLWVPGMHRANVDLYLWINHFYWAPLANLTAFIELPAELFGVLFAIIMAHYRRYEMALCILIAIVIGVIYVTITKNLTALSRPFIDLIGINAAYFPSDFSFPSGHATGAFAVFSVWCFKTNKHYIPLLGFAALVAFSRVYIGVHFPLDVIAGAVVGLIIGFWVARLDLSKWVQRLINVV